MNHPLSRTDNVTNIDCSNLPASNWTNIIYQLDGCVQKRKCKLDMILKRK